LARLATTRFMSVIARRVMPGLDRFVLGRTDGRTTATAWLTGLPALWVTTTGARSGQRRTVPLVGIPFGVTLALLGTRFGHRDTPSWVYNLMADPKVEIEFNERVIAAIARPALPEEEPVIWESAARLYPGYASYSGRAGHRRIAVFVLEPR
jgi:deazaflavin-dependent oxidoreductase (nitroreductase family)